MRSEQHRCRERNRRVIPNKDKRDCKVPFLSPSNLNYETFVTVIPRLLSRTTSLVVNAMESI